MKKSFLGWIVFSGIVMCLLPWLTAAFVKADAGMAVLLLLFFIVNPIYSVLAGAAAGKNVRRLWSLPLISAAFFLLGAWAFFEIGELDFLLYAGFYLVLGLAAMLVSWLLKKRK